MALDGESAARRASDVCFTVVVADSDGWVSVSTAALGSSWRRLITMTAVALIQDFLSPCERQQLIDVRAETALSTGRLSQEAFARPSRCSH